MAYLLTDRRFYVKILLSIHITGALVLSVLGLGLPQATRTTAGLYGLVLLGVFIHLVLEDREPSEEQMEAIHAFCDKYQWNQQFRTIWSCSFTDNSDLLQITAGEGVVRFGYYPPVEGFGYEICCRAPNATRECTFKERRPLKRRHAKMAIRMINLAAPDLAAAEARASA